MNADIMNADIMPTNADKCRQKRMSAPAKICRPRLFGGGLSVWMGWSDTKNDEKYNFSSFFSKIPKLKVICPPTLEIPDEVFCAFNKLGRFNQHI